MAEAELAVIGGTGFYDMDGLSDIKELDIQTPYGDPFCTWSYELKMV